MAKLLLVEDNVNMARVAQLTLESDRHIVDLVGTCAEAMRHIHINFYDLLILDWSLPDGTGLDLCKLYRSMGGNRPILMLSVRYSSGDKVAAFSAGADDYVVKPFDPDELLARVQALLRRPPVMDQSVLHVGHLALDKQTFEVSKDGRSVVLQPKEFAILQLLMEHPDKYFTADGILARVWGDDLPASTESVRTQMKTLRKKLGDTGQARIIESKRGLGYKMSGDGH